MGTADAPTVMVLSSADAEGGGRRGIGGLGPQADSASSESKHKGQELSMLSFHFYSPKLFI